MVKRLTHFVAVAIAATWIATVFSNTILDNTYVGYPREPDPAKHLVMPYSVKGIVVYITSGQMEVILIFRYVMIISGILTVILIVVNQFFSF